MHNVPRKCLEKILRAKNQASLAFEKSFFDIRFWILAYLEYDFLKIDKNVSQLSRNYFYVSHDALSYTKR